MTGGDVVKVALGIMATVALWATLFALERIENRLDALTAPVGRSAERQDAPRARLDRNDEHAVPAEEQGGAQTPEIIT